MQLADNFEALKLSQSMPNAIITVSENVAAVEDVDLLHTRPEEGRKNVCHCCENSALTTARWHLPDLLLKAGHLCIKNESDSHSLLLH